MSVSNFIHGDDILSKISLFKKYQEKMQFSVLYVCNFSSKVDILIMFISSYSLKIQLSITVLSFEVQLRMCQEI